MKKFISNPYFIICLLWLFATIINVNKPFHMNDTFYLEAAKWIEKKPLAPSYGMINWDKVKKPVSEFNQPPLYPYLIAFWGKMVGYSEVSLHLFFSVFSFLAFLFFYFIAKRILPKIALFLLALFAFSPAFLINQNIMPDIPLLAFSFMCIYFLLKAFIRDSWQNYFLASIFFSIGMMISYSIFPISIVFAFAIWKKQNPKYFSVLLIPVLVLIAWNIQNYYQTGIIQFVQIQNDISIFTGLLSVVIGIGAVSPFTLLFHHAFHQNRKRTAAFISWSVILAVILFIGLNYFYTVSQKVSNYILMVAFITNGILFLAAALFSRKFKSLINSDANTEDYFSWLTIWWVSILMITVLFTPVITTKHILPMLAPLLLVSGLIVTKTSKRLRIISLVFTIVLGILLSVSDYKYAGYYHSSPASIKERLHTENKIWFTGHWGWQWYATKAGMIQYHSSDSTVKVLDFFVVPKAVERQKIAQYVKRRKYFHAVLKSSPLVFFSTAGESKFNSADIPALPWFFNKQPIDTIVVYQVVELKK